MRKAQMQETLFIETVIFLEWGNGEWRMENAEWGTLSAERRTLETRVKNEKRGTSSALKRSPFPVPRLASCA